MGVGRGRAFWPGNSRSNQVGVCDSVCLIGQCGRVSLGYPEERRWEVERLAECFLALGEPDLT